MSRIKERFHFYKDRIRSGRLKEMLIQTKWIYGYAKGHFWAMFFYTLLGMSGIVIGLLSNLNSKDLVDVITKNRTGEVVKIFILMIVLSIISNLLGQLSNFASSWISMKVDAEIKADIFEKILHTDWESLTNYHTGDLLTRWSNDASNISSGVLNFLPNFITTLFRFISAFAVVVYYDWTFAIFALLGAPVSLLLSKTLMNRMVNNNQKSAAIGAELNGFNQESFSNIQILKAFDLLKLYTNRLKELQNKYIKMRVDFQKMSIGTSLLLSTVALMVSYSSYGWGIYRVWSGAITYGTMTMFISLSSTLTASLNSLVSIVPQAISLTISAGRLMDIVEMPQEDYSKDKEALEFLNNNKESGISLLMDDISYSYKNGTEVFDHAGFKADPHEIVALVGPSGEGKTTMLRLILSLMPCSGTAKLSGKNGEISLSPGTRKVFSYVPQGNTMLSGTIAENMRNVKDDATDEEIIEALKLACAYDFVNKLPDGINSEIKERGGGFSEGQAQRLSIARALLRKSPVLLLDEATSALDVATERKVLRNIMQDDYPRTCIVTTHRPTVLNLCTRVYKISDKRCTVLNEDEIEELIRDF